MPQFLYPQVGVVVGFPLLLLVTVALVLAMLRYRRRWHAIRDAEKPKHSWQDKPSIDDYADGWWLITFRILVGMAALAVVITTLTGLVPFKPSYWGVYAVQGRVAGISNQLASSDGEISGIYYSIAFEGGPSVLYTSDDTRLSSVKRGDELGLKCRKVWHFNAVDSWSCDVRNFGYVEKGADQ